MPVSGAVLRLCVAFSRDFGNLGRGGRRVRRTGVRFFDLGRFAGMVWRSLRLFARLVIGTFWAPGGLELRQQRGQRLVVHVVEPRERLGRLVPYVHEDHRLVGRGAPEFEVQQALVQDADVLRREVREVDGGLDPDGPAALTNARPAPAQEPENSVHDRVARAVRGGLEGRQGAAHGVLRGRVAGAEEATAVPGHEETGAPRRPRVSHALGDEAPQRQEARPGAARVA